MAKQIWKNIPSDPQRTQLTPKSRELEKEKHIENQEDHQTFREVDVALQVVNVEAPEESRYEVERGAADVVSEPDLERPRERLPDGVRQ